MRFDALRDKIGLKIRILKHCLTVPIPRGRGRNVTFIHNVVYGAALCMVKSLNFNNKKLKKLKCFNMNLMFHVISKNLCWFGAILKDGRDVGVTK